LIAETFHAYIERRRQHLQHQFYWHQVLGILVKLPSLCLGLYAVIGWQEYLLGGIGLSVLAAYLWWIARPLQVIPIQQLWYDYLQEIRQSFLLPQYQHLALYQEFLRHSDQVYNDLNLEETEAHYWQKVLAAQTQWLNHAPPLPLYAQQVQQVRHQWAQLLSQLQDRVESLERGLFNLEVELTQQVSWIRANDRINLLHDNYLDRFREMDLPAVPQLSQEILSVDQSLQRVKHKMNLLLHECRGHCRD
jgi:signal transduction histidine kinase